MNSIVFKVLKKFKITNEIKELRKKGARIGENVDIINSHIDTTHPHLITIKDNTTLTSCTILTHDASTKKTLGKSKIGCVEIGKNCFIGWGSIVLPNVVIGDNCIIGAGSVVTKDIPDNSVAAGNPCKVIGKTNEYIDKNKEKMKTHPVFNMNYKQMNESQKKEQYEALKEHIMGYNN